MTTVKEQIEFKDKILKKLRFSLFLYYNGNSN